MQKFKQNETMHNMQLHTLSKITKARKKRGGQGHGSGRGKTSGRGTKGQKARNKVPLRFEGNQLSLLNRMPFRRGKGRNKSFKDQPLILNIKVLNLFPKGTTVDMDSLIKYKVVVEKDARKYGIKILGDGELNQVLTVALPVSKGAKEKIEKAGGSVR